MSRGSHGKKNLPNNYKLAKQDGPLTARTPNSRLPGAVLALPACLLAFLPHDNLNLPAYSHHCFGARPCAFLLARLHARRKPVCLPSHACLAVCALLPCLLARMCLPVFIEVCLPALHHSACSLRFFLFCFPFFYLFFSSFLSLPLHESSYPAS